MSVFSPIFLGGPRRNNIIDAGDSGVKANTGVDMTAALNAFLAKIRPGDEFKLPDGVIHVSDSGFENALIFPNFSKWRMISDKTEFRPMPSTVTPFQFGQFGGTLATDYTPLSSDAAKGDNKIVTASAIPNVSAGDYITLRSRALVRPLAFNNKKASALEHYKVDRVVGTGPVTYYLNDILFDDYLVTDVAGAGKSDFLTDITFEGLGFDGRNFEASNQDGDDDIPFKRGLEITAVDRLKFNSFSPNGTKKRNELGSVSGRSGAQMNAVLNFEGYDSQASDLGWYFMDPRQACRNHTLRGGNIRRARHIEAGNHPSAQANPDGGVYDFFGRCRNMKFYDINATDMSESAFAGHDLTEDIYYENCKSDRAGIDSGIGAYGFYSRGVNVRHYNCQSTNSSLDGFRADGNGDGTVWDLCRSENSGRNGFMGDHINVIRPQAHNNKEAGISAVSGTITGGASQNNGADTSGSNANRCAVELRHKNGETKKLTVDGLYAPKEGTQRNFMRIESLVSNVPNTLDAKKRCTLRNNDMSGYGDQLYYRNGTEDTTRFNVPSTDGSNILDSDGTEGEATLVSGSATVANTKARDFTPSSGSRNCAIKTIVKYGTNTSGAMFTSATNDKVNFTAKSTDPASTDVVLYKIGH